VEQPCSALRSALNLCDKEDSVVVVRSQPTESHSCDCGCGATRSGVRPTFSRLCVAVWDLSARHRSLQKAEKVPSRFRITERVDDPDSGVLEIDAVARDDGQIVDECGGSDQAVFDGHRSPGGAKTC